MFTARRLTGVRALVSLDTMLCPEAPERLVAEDWEHNVHADYQVLADLGRADAARRGLRSVDPGQSHAECDVWALWRSTARAATAEQGS